MLKFVVLFAAIAALASSASLRITPNELHEIYEIVEKGIHQLKEDADLRILDIGEGLESFTEAARGRLMAAMEEVNREFHEEVERLEREHQHDEDITRCVRETAEEIQHLDDELVDEMVEKIEHDAREALQVAQQLVDDAVEELDRLGREVDQCDETRCADDLAEEIEMLQDKVGDEIEQALNTAHEIVQNLEEETEFDLRDYEESVHRLFEQLQRCADDNDNNDDNDDNDDGPQPPQ